MSAEQKAGARQGLTILAGSALPVMGVVLLAPVAQNLREQLSDASLPFDVTSLVLTAPALAIALFSPLAGYFVDRVGRRPVLLSMLLLYGVVGMAPVLLNHPLAIVAARFLLGIAEAGILAANFALIGDYFQGEQRRRWIAYKSSVAALMATLFYIVGGFLGEWGWRAPFAFYGIGILIALPAARYVFEPPKSPQTERYPVPSAPRAGVVLPYLVITLLCAILFYIVPLQLGLFLERRGEFPLSAIGVMIALAGLGNPVGALAFRFLSHISLPVLMLASALLAGAGLVVAAMSPGAPALVLGGFINQVGCGLFVPITVSSLLQVAPSERRGTSGGAWSTAFFIGQFFSPLFVAELIQRSSAGGELLMLGLINLAIGVVAYFALRGVRRVPASGESARVDIKGLG
ncbi:MFS transporter [Parahaliea mediterranea]|uniref:MFS transporter n=1 Tax=Parahaliea mediterranea TaxID=651086 RepID=UPI000E2FC78A|nr:MFS transporter [Parahaliea mediterranea]